ncbi:3-phenylpropionate/trans-cinnamate dioxygenase ferredoxin reductase subunit [Sphaerotilus hippei]|uniref:3-phenylpropionate/trans-cinnamate dioxygenase ferredoxin reductase subunit n=1 Tax=Sphaerotilus hippei TaxID=744406 RepID=A0A318GX06_9BURK|nr:FAD-dependent oxidoreductase [Sphaerotilus hippei]PXW93978.1 3-phenylpropionate/trans-cinnamate dioxygenase ferredoxin reductase subunit [Sphaerotilus hippei]
MHQIRAMVIVGAGHAGGRAGQALRELGWKGPIVMIGAETHLPYERPPLSKGLLTGAQDAVSCALRPAADHDRDLITHCVAWVDRIDTRRREVVLDGGRRIAYEALLLATGGHLRRLSVPGAGGAGLLGLRTLDDAASLQPRLTPGARLVIVGGGFIGLEVAASARQRGCEVTLIEGAASLLGRAVPPAIGARVLALHRAHGVDVRLQASPTAFGTDGQGHQTVQLADGSVLTADTVVVGVGIVPATELAEAAGLAVARGIRVDAGLRTSDAHVFAAGDVAEFPSPLSGEPIRQETWHNAETQARVAAANMLGGHETCSQLPWFWSDQYDHQLQVSGEPALGVRRVSRLLGDEAQIDFHLDGDGRLVGASGFGPTTVVARELKLARLLVERRRQPAAEALADPGVKLKSLA